MSAQKRKPEKQVKYGPGKHPNARAAHFKPGESGNPGGQRKGVVYIAEAYKRLGVMPLADLKKATFENAIETSVQQALLRAAEATDWQAAHAALKEIADRIDGKAVERKQVQGSATITVRFERPEFQDYGHQHPDAAPGAEADIDAISPVQRTGVRATLRQIAAGAVPADGDGAGKEAVSLVRSDL